MFESRAAQVDLILMRSAGEARGINSLLYRCCWLAVGVLDMCGVCGSVRCTSILSYDVTLSMNFFFQSTQLSGVC